MKPVLPLFIMLDACGWEIIRNRNFLEGICPFRRRLESVFGYSSTCVPSIVSGRWPEEHRNWCYFVYDPLNSPFRSLRPLRWLPGTVTNRRIFRNFLTKFVKRKLGFRGYFDLYNIPFKYIHLYDFTEKKSPLKPGGMNRGSNIFDYLEQKKTSYFGSDPDVSEEKNKADLLSAIRKESIDFGFIYWPGLDGLLHRVGNKSPEIGKKLEDYEIWIQEVLATAEEHYEEVRLYVFSDHGMANCDEILDLQGQINTLDIKQGRDYAVVYDSTMARFWFFNESARKTITAQLGEVKQGRIVPKEELKELRAYFDDNYFGELIFLVREGVLIVPSHMGERPIRAMHGYHPAEPQSYAALMTNNEDIPKAIEAIPDIYRLMTRDAVYADKKNNKTEITLKEDLAKAV